MSKTKVSDNPAPALPSTDLEIERLERVIGELPAAASPAARTDTKRYLIERLRGPLLLALVQRGCSFASIAESFARAGVSVHVSTLRRYLGPVGTRRALFAAGVPDTLPPPVRPPERQASTPEPETALPDVQPTPATRAITPAPVPGPALPLSDAPLGAPGTFTPRPERPIDWYKPSS